MKKRVYLSGRMSGLPSEIWQARFFGAQRGFEFMGMQAVNPADTLIARHPWLYRIVGYRLTLAYDLWLLKHCTHIHMVGDDWHLSRGARLERMKARQWGISELKPRERDKVYNDSILKVMTNKEAIKYLQQLYPNGGHCWLDEQRIEAIGMAVKALQEEPVSEDLDEAAKMYARGEYDRKNPSSLPWQCKGCYSPLIYAFKDGAQWQKEQFEKNRLKHCDSITNEQAEMEQKFLDQHLDKHQRMPTFLDAIEYGMSLQKEQMMAKAINTKASLTMSVPSICISLPLGVKVGDKVKVIVIKKD